MLLQHMADCYKALFTNKLSCVSTSVAITQPGNEFKSIHALRKNINMVPMLALDVLLRHFRKGMYHGGDRRLHTLISYVVLVPHVCMNLAYSTPLEAFAKSNQPWELNVLYIIHINAKCLVFVTSRSHSLGRQASLCSHDGYRSKF